MGVIVLVGAVSMTYLMHRSSRDLVATLDSPDSSTVTYSLLVLKQRHDPAGISRATELLHNQDKDVQTASALYLGAMGKSQSIPTLINALNGADEQTGREISIDLTMMTGEDFGGNYQQWKRWWDARNSTKPAGATGPF